MGQQASAVPDDSPKERSPGGSSSSKDWCKDATSDVQKPNRHTDFVRIVPPARPAPRASGFRCGEALPKGPDVLVSEITSTSATVFWSNNQDTRKAHIDVLLEKKGSSLPFAFFEASGDAASFELPEGSLPKSAGPFRAQVVLESGPADRPQLTEPGMSEPFFTPAEPPSAVVCLRLLGEPRADGFTVEWQPPADDGGNPVEVYEVHLSSSQKDEGVPAERAQVRLANGKSPILCHSTQQCFSGLAPGSDYTVEVCAVAAGVSSALATIEGQNVESTWMLQPLSAPRPPTIFSFPVDPLDAMAFQSADVVAALDMVRRAVASGDDLSQLFAEWSGLERRALVAAINSPAAAPGPVVYGDSSRVTPASSSGVAAAVPAPSDDPCPEPPVDRHHAPPSAHAGVSGAPSSSADMPAAGKPSGGGYPQKPTRPAPSVPKGSPPEVWDQVMGYLCRTDAELAYKHNIPTADAYYRRYQTVLPDRITPSTVIPGPPPPAAPSPSVPIVDYQDRIAEELRRQFEEESRHQRTVGPQVKAMPAASAPSPSPPAPSGSFRRAPTPTPQEMYPDADPITGAGFPILPRRPGQNASPAELERHRREYRRLAHIRRMLCSQEWRDHVELMGKSGVRSDVTLPETLRPLTVANLEHLEDIERAAADGSTAMVPAAAAAAYYVLRALPPGVRGGRIPEKIPGKIWCVGWCGHPCTNGLPRAVPAPVIRSAGPRRYLTVAVFYKVDLTDGLVAGDVGAAGARKEGAQAGARLGPFGPMRPRRGQTADFGRLVRAFVELGASDHLPLLPTVGAVDVDSALARASALVTAGVPATLLETLAGWRTGPVNSDRAGGAHSAQKEQGALAEIDENILAKSSQAPFQSRVRTWQEACETWAVAPWPISAEAVRKVAATFRRGGYRSVQNYFDAAVSYQEQFRGEAVDPLIRRAMRRYARAVVRGLPGSKLKAIFAVDRLVALVSRVDPPGADIDVADGTVALRLPLHKTATGGGVELTQRQLRCTCGATVAPLCPYHAALRHVSRLRRAGRWVRGAPLFPDGTGDTWEKSETVLFFRRVLLAAGIQLTTTDHNGATVQLFNGHLARVVNTPIIQLLGRWSSAAVERYVQAAPLAVAPDVPRRILADDVEIVSVRPAYGDAISQVETPPHEDHSPTVAFEPGPVRPETVKQVAVAPPEHLIYNERQKRAHLVADVLTDFDDLATSAGAGPDLVEYLKVRSLNRTATLALVADEWSDVDARVFQPFRDGDEIAGKTYKATPAEQPVVRAIIRHMWSEARRQWNEFSTPAPAPSTAAPPPATLPTMVGEKPPRTFPEWTDLVARYNAVQLGGEPRSFPAERLVGAEEVLARIHWEHTKSTRRSASARSSLGVVNPLAGRRSTGGAQHQVRGRRPGGGGEPAVRPEGHLGRRRRPGRHPLGVGPDRRGDRGRYVDWWTTKARLHSSKLEAVVAYWDATAHQLAMSMRLARTFEEVTSAILADQAAFNEALQSAVKPGPPRRPTGAPTGGPPSHPTEDDHTADTPKGYEMAQASVC
ncbi:unnamed protein product [Symbiodinium sp. CCMP2592]|nr:unnamed protein product [Symbiodinium sp. CCMP2592]